MLMLTLNAPYCWVVTRENPCIHILPLYPFFPLALLYLMPPSFYPRHAPLLLPPPSSSPFFFFSLNGSVSCSGLARGWPAALCVVWG